MSYIDEMKGKKKAKGEKGIDSGSKSVIEIDPDIIYFTHARVRPFFTGCNKRIDQTFQEIRNGETKIEDIPLITVIVNDGNYFSLNNRRLFLWKWLKVEGLLEPKNTIHAYIKSPLEREKKRYTPSRCSLHARLMKEAEKHEINTPEMDEETGDHREETEKDVCALQSISPSCDMEGNPRNLINDEDDVGETVKIAPKSSRETTRGSVVNHFSHLSFDDQDSDDED